ncbi:glycosyltransferase [Bacillus cereus]|uniref:Glycosyltransferase n=1 Tax=Bacillus cereus TaxID=1396 RepID=A0A9X7QI33_BACCE|nr:glycosyltransferase [Bacillus cereus]
MVKYLNLDKDKLVLNYLFLQECLAILQEEKYEDNILLGKLEKRIKLLNSLTKCSEGVYEYIFNEEYKKGLEKISPKDIKDFLSENLVDNDIRISVNILTYNEERCIERSIDSVKEIADEIIIIDTGSTDNTVNIIRTKYPEVRLFQEKWTNDFSYLRNKMINYSNFDWIFQIDADEFLSDSAQELKELIALFDDFTKRPLVISPVIVNHDDYELDNTKRIFKKSTHLRYFGLVHEELRLDTEKRGTDIEKITTNYNLFHDGYKPEVLKSKEKFLRNKKLLEKMIKIERKNIKWHYLLGREKYELNEEYEEIVQILKNGLNYATESSEDQDIYLASLVKLCEIYYNKKKIEDFKDTVDEINNKFPNCMDGEFFKLMNGFNSAMEQLSYIADETYNYMKERHSSATSIIHTEGYHLFNLLSRVYFSIGNYEKAFSVKSLVQEQEMLMLFDKEINNIINLYKKFQ